MIYKLIDKKVEISRLKFLKIQKIEKISEIRKNC